MPVAAAADRVDRSQRQVYQAEIDLWIDNEFLGVRGKANVRRKGRRALLVGREAHENEIGIQTDPLPAHVEVGHQPDVEVLDSVGETRVDGSSISSSSEIPAEASEPQIQRFPVAVPVA